MNQSFINNKTSLVWTKYEKAFKLTYHAIKSDYYDCIKQLLDKDYSIEIFVSMLKDRTSSTLSSIKKAHIMDQY